MPEKFFHDAKLSSVRFLIFSLSVMGMSLIPLHGATRDTIAYSGDLMVDGRPFDGTGLFKFLLMDKDGASLWESSTPDSSGIPQESIALPVTGGAYSVSLGSTEGNMPELPEAVVEAFPNLTLRIWFDDGEKGFQLLKPDQNLAKAPQRMVVSGSKKAEPKTTVDTATKKNTGNSAKTGNMFRLAEPPRYAAGSSKAKIVLVEYSDYECGHCRLFHEVTFPKIKEEYIDTGLVYFLSGNYPLNNHRYSQKAAEASYCAGEQGQYWAMRDLLFENNMNLGNDTFLSLAGQLGLDLERFRGCLESNLFTKEIQQEKLSAKSLGIRQTPSFILGHSRDADIIEGEIVAGSRLWTEFKRQINRLLTQP